MQITNTKKHEMSRDPVHGMMVLNCLIIYEPRQEKTCLQGFLPDQAVQPHGMV